MPIISAEGLEKFHADVHVLRGAALSIEPKEKVALIGRNGTGKTTLLRLLAGLDPPDRGTVSISGWARVGYLPQSPQGPGGLTVIEHVLGGAADVQSLETRLGELEQLMGTPDVHDDPDRLGEVLGEYARVRDRFEHVGGFTLQARAGMVLSGLGFTDATRRQGLETLSGGWRVRAELARVLLAEPDLLLLDEPTNHLDLAATEWLEDYLREFPGATVVVGHDRYLLDAVTSRTLDLVDGTVTSYPGSYSKYTALKAQEVEREAELFERQQEEIAKLQAYIRRYKAGNRATQAKSREKMLARVRARELSPPRERGAMRLPAQAAPVSGRLVLRLKEVDKRYDGRAVLQSVGLEIHRGERIGLLGANGAGKTTLLKLMAGLEAPTSGSVSAGVKVRARYFAQEAAATLDVSSIVLDEVLGSRPMTPEQVRTYLGRFLFSGDDVFKRVGSLSGGERQRLSLASLLLDEPNVLLLDEPTNHLDIPSREALEAALLEFPGTLVVATHDRYLLERLATRMLTIHDGRVTDFRGTYHELRDRKAPPQAPSRPAPRKARLIAQVPRSVGPSVDQVVSEITAVEQELHDAGRSLADPETYRDPERVKTLRRQYDQAEQRLAELYEVLAQAEEQGP